MERDSRNSVRERQIEAFRQLLIAERLAEKADRPGIERMVACPLIRKRCDKNDWRAPTLRDQELLELDAAQPFI